MGLLVEGKWQDTWYNTEKTNGKFIREDAQFRKQILDEPNATHPVEKNRYHLYVANACPWAHRTLIVRKLKQLEPYISVDVVHPHMLDKGWTFKENCSDQLFNAQQLSEIYLKANPKYSGRVTVPLLWDKQHATIVNNESADIIRIFNQAFNSLTQNKEDYYPQALQSEIDHINEEIYHKINNGVYKVGFATTQSAYDEAFNALFNALEQLEVHLTTQDYLVGNQLTEADIRLFPTLIRFDLVYYVHFKCNYKMIKDYKNLFNYLMRIYQHPGIADTLNIEQIKAHYYYSHQHLNPHRIVPLGPCLDWLK
jgi:putative glutathione S-transferase